MLALEVIVERRVHAQPGVDSYTVAMRELSHNNAVVAEYPAPLSDFEAALSAEVQVFYVQWAESLEGGLSEAAAADAP